MTASVRKTAIFTVLLVMAMFIGTVSAYAVSDEATTTAQVTFTKLPGGSAVFPAGTSRGDIIAALRTKINKPAGIYPSSFIINVGGLKYTVARADMNQILPATVNYGAMGDLALSATSARSFAPADCLAKAYTPAHKAAISRLSAKVATYYTTPAKGMKYTMSSKKKFVITNSSTGYSVSAQNVSNAIYAANALWAEAGYTGPMSANVSRTVSQAGIVKRSQLGKAIMVDRSERMLYLYNQGKVVAKYRVAIGMRGYTTPLGTYTIGAKRSKPSWGNPGSKWARNMPRIIKPGPNNPLGLRAMNLNKGSRDTGLRIHGTANTRSLGTASSHGCIRVANKNIVKLFKATPGKTKVFVQQ